VSEGNGAMVSRPSRHCHRNRTLPTTFGKRTGQARELPSRTRACRRRVWRL